MRWKRSKLPPKQNTELGGRVEKEKFLISMIRQQSSDLPYLGLASVYPEATSSQTRIMRVRAPLSTFQPAHNIISLSRSVQRDTDVYFNFLGAAHNPYLSLSHKIIYVLTLHMNILCTIHTYIQCHYFSSCFEYV